jgi:pyruvate formate lyase activating enzyme
MSVLLFTAADCVRCNIARRFVRRQGLAVEEKDVTADGREPFRRFYAANRGSIQRGAAGIAFPLLADGDRITQGAAPVVARLAAGGGLDGFFADGEAPRGWAESLDVGSGDPASASALVEVLGFLARNGLKLELVTDGRHPGTLERLLAAGLGDRAVMELLRPAILAQSGSEPAVPKSDIEKSMRLLPRFPEYRFRICIAPRCSPGPDPADCRYATPEEIGDAAHRILKATGSRKHPCSLRLLTPQEACPPGCRQDPPASPPASLFIYRTRAREFQVYCEIEVD